MTLHYIKFNVKKYRNTSDTLEQYIALGDASTAKFCNKNI